VEQWARLIARSGKEKRKKRRKGVEQGTQGIGFSNAQMMGISRTARIGQGGV